MTLTLDNLDARYHELFDLLGPRKAQVLAFTEFIVFGRRLTAAAARRLEPDGRPSRSTGRRRRKELHGEESSGSER